MWSDWPVLKCPRLAGFPVSTEARSVFEADFDVQQVPPSQWVQITRLPDSVMQPALSPDGRMLAFLRGSNTFIGEAELYVKLLPVKSGQGLGTRLDKAFELPLPKDSSLVKEVPQQQPQD